MFGGSAGFGGFGQQQQQQQQQQPQQGAGLFGGGGAFGSTPAFGAPAAPQFGQQQQNTGFGGFGSPAAAPAFGAAPAAPAFGGSSLFGAPAPAANTGFSFGAANPAFGAPKTSAVPSGGLFGAKPVQQSFGFGAQAPAASGGMFGGASSAFGAAAAPISGTAAVPFKETPEDVKDVKGMSTNEFHLHQSITSMDAYKNFSFEELRFQDYQANRKTPTVAAQQGFGGGFGQQQPAFGAPQQAGGIFGQQQAQVGAFGQPAVSAPAFGAAPNAFSAGFGAPAPSPFGAPAPAANPFASPGGFGQPQQPAATPSFGFGAPAAPKPAFSFGQPQAAAPTSLFGAQPQQQPGLFGQPAQPAASPGLFGQAQPQQTSFGFGGAAAAAPKPLFGSAPAANAFPAAKPFSFGAPAAPAAGGLFGAPAQPTGFGAPAAPTGGLFSTPAPAFGQTQPAPSLFGGGGGLFGAKPAAPTSLFGASAPAPSGGLFSSQPASSFQNPGLGNSFGGSLSTNTQAPPPSAVAQSEDPNAYGSNPLFALMAGSPANRIVEKKKPPMWRLPDNSGRSTTKITRLRGFGQSSTSASPSGIGRGASLGFGASLGASSGSIGGTPGTPRGGRDSPLRLMNGLGDESALSPSAFVSRASVKKLVIDRKAIEEHTTGSPSAAPPRSKEAGSAGKPKVSFNPEVNFPRDRVLRQSTTSNLHDNDADFADSTPVKRSAGNNANLGETPSTSDNPSTTPKSDWPSRNATSPRIPKHGEYFSQPSLESLQKLPASKLSAVRDLVVGRVGYGQVAFQQPADLTTLLSVQDLYGAIIIFEDRNCTVYPPDYPRKASPGQGLNVEATITLERCWPLDKSTRQPIKDEQNPRLIQHVKRLRNLEDTSFIDFSAGEGTWVFSVVGF